MNMQVTEKNWTELRGRIKSKWSHFNDVELEGFKSDLSQLSGKVQKSYGLTKEQADQQCEDFKKSVQSMMTDGASPQAGSEASKVTSINEVTSATSKANSVETPAPVKAAKVG